MDQYLRKIDKTIRYHFRKNLNAIRGYWWDTRHLKAEKPVFIVGCSRAGTTLVYKTFSEAQNIGSLQRETHDFWASLHPLAERNWASHGIEPAQATEADRKTVTRYFYSQTGCIRFVDKNNQNGLCIPYLQRLFPDAFFVYVKRSPGDNINSLIEGWRRPNEFATWSDALPAKTNIDAGEFRRWSFFLADGWRGYLDSSIEAVCAFQYRAMNQAILDAGRSVSDDQWTEIRYEDLVNDPISGFRNLFDACGLPFSSRLEAHCATVLKNPYNAFSEIKLDKWKSGPNREKVARVLPGLTDLAKRMGYTDGSWETVE